MQIGAVLQKVRVTNPLVHNITNVVVTNFTANGLLSLGASPVMAYAAEEVADMAKIAGALVLNIGTLNEAEINSMIIAGKSANQHGVPVIFDPVGAGATAYRTDTARKIINEIQISVLRGNAAEIANVAGRNRVIKGVDAGGSQGNTVELAVSTAEKFKCVVIVTGPDDVISDGVTTYIVHNGDPMLTKVTGTGCLLTSVVGAFAAIEDDLLLASLAAVASYGVSAEAASTNTAGRGPGTFQIEFLNQLHLVTPNEIEQRSRFQKIT